MNKRVRRIGALGLAASTLALAGAAIAGAAGTGDVQGPSCADIVDGVGGYTGTTVGVQLELADGSCQGVTYTLVAVDEADSTTVVGSSSRTGDGSALLSLEATIADDDDTVCVYVKTTAGRGPHVFDRGPDAGCVSMTRNNAPGFQDFG